ncbi:13 kDa [Spodoptera frugiperda ascovirus 1a]|uniref:13 kDa n=1 Tax=Spodoptera frugiperda ascovirus 1a TaxID=113370 RepID=Q0E512_SFAVA|nr:13 kDa [Spodoptera frugiperda ascovirus 1a]CAL44689.1 13 kDa [Spodoptera frugiperda ascovirus 1a]
MRNREDLRTAIVVLAPGVVDDCTKLRHEIEHIARRTVEVWNHFELQFPLLYHDHQPLFMNRSPTSINIGKHANLPRISRNDAVVRYYRLTPPTIVVSMDRSTGKRELRSVT